MVRTYLTLLLLVLPLSLMGKDKPSPTATEKVYSTVKKLLGELSSGNRLTRISARATLEVLEEKIYPLLGRALRDPDGGVRFGATLYLEKMGPAAKSTIPALIQTLDDGDGNVRLGAARALVSVGKPVIPYIVKELGHSKAHVRRLTCWILAKMGPDAGSTWDQVHPLLNDKSQGVRLEAARALLSMSYKKTSTKLVLTLLDFLHYRNTNTKLTALRLLEKTGARGKLAIAPIVAIMNDPQNPRNLRYQAYQTLSQMGPAVVPHMKKILDSPRSPGLLHAIYVCRKLGPQAHSTVPTLGKIAVSHQKPRFREEALSALGEIGAKAKPALPQITRALQDQGLLVRKRAAEALGDIGHDTPSIVSALIAATRDGEWQVRLAAAKSLGKLGKSAKKALPALEKLKKDSHFLVRITAQTSRLKIQVQLSHQKKSDQP